jgi:hypothetical protein
MDIHVLIKKELQLNSFDEINLADYPTMLKKYLF